MRADHRRDARRTPARGVLRRLAMAPDAAEVRSPQAGRGRRRGAWLLLPGGAVRRGRGAVRPDTAQQRPLLSTDPDSFLRSERRFHPLATCARKEAFDSRRGAPSSSRTWSRELRSGCSCVATSTSCGGCSPADLHLSALPASAGVLFGTESLGRDLFSRIIIASRISLSIGLVGVLLSFLLGSLLGGLSGYYGGAGRQPDSEDHRAAAFDSDHSPVDEPGGDHSARLADSAHLLHDHGGAVVRRLDRPGTGGTRQADQPARGGLPCWRPSSPPPRTGASSWCT